MWIEQFSDKKPQNKYFIFLVLSGLLLLAFSACLDKSSLADNYPKKAQGKLREAKLMIADKTVMAEVAISNEEQITGLMFREKLEDGRGMLFVYDSDRKLSFWMKNTKLPLSVAYIDSDFIIREIYDMEPYSLDPVESELSLRYALEVPLGWFDRTGIKPGAKMIVSPDALKN